MTRIRSFLGLDLPAEVRSALTVQQFLLPLPRAVDPASMHLTLVWLGEQTASVLSDVDDALSALRLAPFDLALSGLGLFGGARARAAWAGVAPNAALMHLQEKAETAIRRAGCPVEGRRFHPHVTLGRFAPPAPDQAMRLERAIAAGAGFSAGPWRVTEMILWESRLRPDGPVYHELVRYPLG